MPAAATPDTTAGKHRRRPSPSSPGHAEGDELNASGREIGGQDTRSRDQNGVDELLAAKSRAGTADSAARTGWGVPGRSGWRTSRRTTTCPARHKPHRPTGTPDLDRKSVV